MITTPRTSDYRTYLVNSKPFATQAEAIAEATTMLATGGSLTITPTFDKHGYLEAKAVYKLYQECVADAAFVMSTTAARPMHPDADLTDLRRRYQAAKQGKLVQAEIARLQRHAYNERYAMRQVSSTHKQAWQRQLDLQATLTRIKHLTIVLSDWPQFGADHLPIVEKPAKELHELRDAEYAAKATYKPMSQPELIQPDWDKLVPRVDPKIGAYCDLGTREVVYGYELVPNPRPKKNEGPYDYIMQGVSKTVYSAPASIDDNRLEQYVRGTDPKRGAIKSNKDALDRQLVNKTLSYSWTPELVDMAGE